jgi:molybdopterin molybdotransferase
MDDGLLSVSQAQARILEACRPMPSEWVPLEQALGRALLQDVLARHTQPPYDNSAMDGYAVRAEDAQQPGSRLHVVEAIYAGQLPTRALGAREAARIMTGAPVPEGTSAVVMQEMTRALPGQGLGDVEILEAITAGTNVRPAGEDARAGDLLLAKGTALGIPELGLLWGQGFMGAEVPRRPQVALLATGDELCRPETHRPGQIIDTNSPSLALSVQRAGGVPRLLGIARDTLEDVERLLALALDADVVLTSAGVSVGERDYVRRAFERLEIHSEFFGVAVKPGKPVAFARRGKTLLFGLPGNPTSSLVAFELFVRPALRRLLGQTDVLPQPVPGRTSVALKKRAALAHYLRVRATWRDGELWAEPLVTQSSGAVRSASTATHLLHFPMEAISLSAGDKVQLLQVSWGP